MRTQVLLPKSEELKVQRSARLRFWSGDMRIEEATNMSSNLGDYTYRDSMPILAALVELGYTEAKGTLRAATMALNSEFGNFDIVRAYAGEVGLLSEKKREVTKYQKNAKSPLRALCRFIPKPEVSSGTWFVPVVQVKVGYPDSRHGLDYTFMFEETLQSLLVHLKTLGIPVKWSKKGKLTTKADAGRVGLAAKRTVVTPAKLQMEAVDVFPLVESLAENAFMRRAGVKLVQNTAEPTSLRVRARGADRLSLGVDLPYSVASLKLTDNNRQQQLMLAKTIARQFGISLEV